MCTYIIHDTSLLSVRAYIDIVCGLKPVLLTSLCVAVQPSVRLSVSLRVRERERQSLLLLLLLPVAYSYARVDVVAEVVRPARLLASLSPSSTRTAAFAESYSL